MVIDAGRPTFAGNNDDKTVKISSIHTQALIVKECPGPGTCEGNVYYDDLWGVVTPGQERGTIADGDYTVKLYRDETFLVGSKAITVNHCNCATGGGSNGTFLDEASDQVVTFYLNSSLSQISAPTVSNQHTRAATHLSGNIIQPAGSDTTITVGQGLTVKGSASNGVGGAKKYAWDWNASGSNQETFDTEFSTSTTATHTYTATGDYKIRLIIRDGNEDAFSGTHGGHYAVSSIKTVHVVPPPPPYDAEGAGNTLPSNITYFTWVATSVSMKNTGTQTWSGTSFKLKQDNTTNFWTPLEVAFGSGSVVAGQTKTFNFNIRTVEPEFCGNQDNYWRMFRTGTGLFGDLNGRITFVSNCPSVLRQLPRVVLAWFKIRLAYANPISSFYPQGEVVQILRQYDFKLPTRDVEAERGFTIRYEAALEDSWDVDFQFRIQYDANSLTVGNVVTGPRGATHKVGVTEVGPGDVIVGGTRLGAAGLDGKGVIIEIPFTLNQGKNPPAGLILVELIASR
ncbi:MAG: hypothetical protein ACREK7_03130 [Gemmatimonadota bacterium]